MNYRDKLLHFFAGFALFVLGWLTLHVAFGWALCGVGAVWKEGQDSRTRNGNRWSWADLLATLAGGGVAHLLIWSMP